MDRISLTLAWFVSPSPESILYAGSVCRPSTEAWTREECLTTIKYLSDGRINVIDNVYPVLPILASVGLLGKQTTATTAATMVGTHEVLETTTATATTTTTHIYTCHWDDNGQWIWYGGGS
jgi:hypothetical protein